MTMTICRRSRSSTSRAACASCGGPLMPRPGIQSINVRVPVALLARVRARAAARRRSLNGQIVRLLETALDISERLETPPPDVGGNLAAALRAYVAWRPEASITEILGEFDLTDQEALAALQAALAAL